MAECYSWIEFLAFYPHKLFLLRRTEFAGQKNRTSFEIGNKLLNMRGRMMVNLGIAGFCSFFWWSS